ncbi:cell dividion protein FtsZ [Sulfurifustis variabilis]|uniref:Cell division protein ZipA n=1 Tax=Sulfurifustis variabilis TaxID=1675686 RepID=A0A1B4V2I4_9GAMM|nr:cell division protein ZipA C-terminal FtsZ-binding domain-containing protein [Sulfurifustis variabilis]BAU47739.1 cell dividion protein FtsZ [Sulfurifustis variabilis]
MDLQLALLLIGSIIVAIVAITAVDRGRIARSLRGGISFRSRPAAVISPARREPVVRPDPAVPAPPVDAERRFLKTEPSLPLEIAPELEPEQDPLFEELESIERIANRPLNLNPGFDPPGTGPEAAVPGRQTVPDESVDFVLHLPGPGPVSRRTALGIYKQNEYKLEYPREIFGQRYQTSFWSTLSHDSDATNYSDLKLSIQLVDNVHGPIGESELNTFVQVGLKLADALHRPAKFSLPFEQALERAKALAKFCDEYDVIAGVNVASDPDSPFKGHAVVAAMQRAGLELGAMNIYHKRADGRLLYSLSNLYKPGNFNPAEWETFRTSGLALFMSVPCVEDPAVVFAKMVESAAAIAGFLGGRLLDQDNRALTEKGIAAIRAQIQGIEGRMRAFGVPPGGESALRLFGAGLN